MRTQRHRSRLANRINARPDQSEKIPVRKALVPELPLLFGCATRPMLRPRASHARELRSRCCKHAGGWSFLRDCQGLPASNHRDSASQQHCVTDACSKQPPSRTCASSPWLVDGDVNMRRGPRKIPPPVTAHSAVGACIRHLERSALRIRPLFVVQGSGAALARSKVVSPECILCFLASDYSAPCAEHVAL